MKSLGLVKVFLVGYGKDMVITFGELLNEDSTTFRVHSSSIIFSRNKYFYKKIIN